MAVSSLLCHDSPHCFCFAVLSVPVADRHHHCVTVPVRQQQQQHLSRFLSSSSPGHRRLNSSGLVVELHVRIRMSRAINPFKRLSLHHHGNKSTVKKEEEENVMNNHEQYRTDLYS